MSLIHKIAKARLPPINQRQLHICRHLGEISELGPSGNDHVPQGLLPSTLGIGVAAVHGRQTVLRVTTGT